MQPEGEPHLESGNFLEQRARPFHVADGPADRADVRLERDEHFLPRVEYGLGLG